MVDNQIILYTSALINNQFESRKNDYIQSYNILLDIIDYKNIFIVECYSNNENFFSEFKSPKFLTNTHISEIKNKGVLEVMGMKKFIENTEISDETLIIKITGRYKFINDDFFKLINTNKNFDFYGKLIDNNTQIFTGCFALRKKHFKNFFNFCNLDNMEKNMINFEKKMFNFLNENNINSFFTDNINIECPIFGYGNIQTHNI
jgi:hypothetical protein